jgi:hypothetical protein
MYLVFFVVFSAFFLFPLKSVNIWPPKGSSPVSVRVVEDLLHTHIYFAKSVFLKCFNAFSTMPKRMLHDATIMNQIFYNDANARGNETSVGLWADEMIQDREQISRDKKMFSYLLFIQIKWVHFFEGIKYL